MTMLLITTRVSVTGTNGNETENLIEPISKHPSFDKVVWS